MSQMQVTVPAGVGPGMPFLIDTPYGGLRLRTLMPRCRSFRQSRSSVASERGVPSDGQIRLHGMGGPRGYLEAQLASQFGRAPRNFSRVKRWVRRWIVAWARFRMACSGGGG